MSERDEDDVPASPASDDETNIEQPVHGTEGSPTDRLVNLAAAAIEPGNPSAIDALAKTITALNGSVGSPNWHQYTPKFELPAIDFPMPKLPAIAFPMPKPNVGRQFDASRYRRLGHTRDVVGIDALMAGRTVADNYLRGINGAGEALTRAIESIAQLTRTGHLARDYSRYLGATGPGSLTGWLDSAVPRIDMTAWSNVVGTASAVNTGMHNAISAAARTMLDLNRSYRALDDVISPALRNWQTRIDEFTRLTPVVQSAAAMWSTQITDLMHGWTVLSDFGHRLAGKALHLALMTRDALINDTDRDAVRQAVIDFMRRVLGYKWHPTDVRIEAVSSALLDDAWLPPVGTAFDGDYNPVDPLRKIVTYQHGLWVPLTETRRRGRTIASLDEPDRAAAHDGVGDPTTPMDRLQAAEFTPKRQPITHPVLKRVLEPLSPIEQEIVMARFCDGARTWADAAIMSGRDAREGETVRRKFLKLKKAEQQRRSA